MTQPAPTYTITTHWTPSKLTDLDEPVTDTAPDWPTARTKALKLTTLRNAIAVVVRDPDGELIANWDTYSNLWREPRPRPDINPTTVDRARILAADYRANPTPARAHNAAQILWDILGTLDAVVARTFTITDENDRLKARIDELETTASILEDSEPFSYDDCRDDCNGCHEGAPMCDCHVPAAEARDRIRDLRDRVERAEEAANLPADLCTADGPRLGAKPTLTCYLAANHEGDHSTNAHPNPRTWPQFATGGIVDPNRIARIGEPSDEWKAANPMKKPCQGVDCQHWTTLSCNRCERPLCQRDAALNRTTWTHSDGSPCTDARAARIGEGS